MSLFTPDKDGKLEDIVVGYNNLKDYVIPPGECFLGACVEKAKERFAVIMRAVSP